jgi:hypothetical protein
MSQHKMRNVMIEKSVNVSTNCTIRLSTLIAIMFQKNLDQIRMKYCKIDANISFQNSGLNYKDVAFESISNNERNA